MLNRRRKALLCTLIAAIGAASAGRAQRAGAPVQAAAPDSAARANVENSVAVKLSGIWDFKGEYKAPNGVFFHASGYFAFVRATSSSNDYGDAALLTMFLEPMAGGASTWLSVRLACSLIPGGEAGMRCTPANGANSLLDCNFKLKGLPFRGLPNELEITEPEEKGAKRWEGRSIPRGSLTLTAPDR